MARFSTEGVKQRRLVRMLALFFLALVIPTSILLYFAYDQMKWEVYHQYRVQAETLSKRINRRIEAWLAQEESRGFAEYGFLVVSADENSNALERSPLAELPEQQSLPGLLGYFQIDPQGTFSSPLIPAAGIDHIRYGVSNEELAIRVKAAERVKRILDQPPSTTTAATPEQTVPRRPADDLRSELADMELRVQAEPQVFQRFDEAESGIVQNNVKSLGRVSALQLDERLEKKSKDKRDAGTSAAIPGEGSRARQQRAARKEQVAVYELAPATPAPAEQLFKQQDAAGYASEEQAGAETIAPATDADLPETPRIRTFESEIGPIELDTSSDEHFVLFRNVWRNGDRYIQGAAIDRDVFLKTTLDSAFANSGLISMSRLLVVWQDNVLNVFDHGLSSRYPLSSNTLSGEVLFRDRLVAPLDELSILFTVTELPLGASIRFLAWVAFVLFSVLVGGCYVIYRFGRGQIALFRQQQDFVSAVSHELKTPLTSIRMYSEMLKQGWAEEDKKNRYYDYIHDESERLSRLINNVLQLARMHRSGHEIELKAVSVNELMTTALSKISSLVEAGGFDIKQEFAPAALAKSIEVDADAFMQIVINIVDNAIKFSRDAERKQIDIRCVPAGEREVEIALRDYGPGVEPKQMKKIFELFYRSENELTRETIGTGIGLALVYQLMQAMGGTIDVHNTQPGAEFRLTFPVVTEPAQN